MEVFTWVGYGTVSILVAIAFAHAAFFCVELYTRTFKRADVLLEYYKSWRREHGQKYESSIGGDNGE